MTPPRLILPVLILGFAAAACQPQRQAEEAAPAQEPAGSTPAAAPSTSSPAVSSDAALAPVAPAAAERTACRDEIGQAAAQALVQRCIQVSPATHPPCNVANPCEMIQGEIDRSCALWSRDGETPPKECSA